MCAKFVLLPQLFAGWLACFRWPLPLVVPEKSLQPRYKELVYGSISERWSR